MAEDRKLTLQLSRDEAAFVAGLLNTTFVPGLQRRLLRDITYERTADALSKAEAGLRARGYLAAGPDGTTQMDEVVMALIGTCAFPTYSLVLIRNPAGGEPQRHLFHHLRGLTVEHSEPEPGLHRFSAVLTGAELNRRLTEILNLARQEAPEGKPVVVAEEAMVRARERARRAGVAAAQDILLGAGLSADDARRVAVALSAVTASGIVVALDHQVEEAEPVRGFCLLEGADGFRRLGYTSTGGQGPLRFQPVGADDLAAELQRLAGPLAEIGRT